MKQILGKSYYTCKGTFEKSIIELLENLNHSSHQEKIVDFAKPTFPAI